MARETEIDDVIETTELSKDLWFELARATFSSGNREACAVCGKYRSLSHAHHVIPLSRQWAERRMVVDHTHEWLCPTHHAAVHVLISHHEHVNSQVLSRPRMAVVLDLSCDEPELLLRANAIAVRAVA